MKNVQWDAFIFVLLNQQSNIQRYHFFCPTFHHQDIEYNLVLCNQMLLKPTLTLFLGQSVWNDTEDVEYIYIWWHDATIENHNLGFECFTRCIHHMASIYGTVRHCEERWFPTSKLFKGEIIGDLAVFFFNVICY